MTLKIENITTESIGEVVDVHMNAFPEFFLTFLGPKFLREFYNSFTYDPVGIGFIAIDENSGQIVGAIVGPLNPEGYFKRLLKRKWHVFCLASLGAVIKKPSVIKRLFRAVFYRGEAPQGPKRALLSSIAVSPNHQKEGIGRTLVKRWMQEVQRQGAAGCFLTTDAVGNDTVNDFYKSLGWTLEAAYETKEGRKMNRYVFDFDKQEEKVE